MNRVASLNYDWRRANGFTDTIAAGCNSCRVQMDREVCKLASTDCTSCPIAKGRFRAVYRSAAKKFNGEQYHLLPVVERLAQQEGILAKLQLERVALIKRGEATDAIDAEIKEAAKLAGKYARECGVAACVRGGQKEDEFDRSVFAGAT